MGKTAPFDVTMIEGFKANKPIRARVKDGKWALFFNGTQRLESNEPLPQGFRYNAPYTISAWVLSTKVGAVSTVVSFSTSHADLATIEFRLGTDPKAGLVNHNGSFESYGAPEQIKNGEGRWQYWVITFDGWMERAYCNGQLVHEQNNFLMIRPEGHVTIGADGSGTNSFMGYIASLVISPSAWGAEEVQSSFNVQRSTFNVTSLGDDDFEEIAPDSKFTLSSSMKPILEKREAQRFSATTADFNSNPLANGGYIYKEVEGDFVVMCRISDMEGLANHNVIGFNEAGLLISDKETYYQNGVFPLYNCGNMLTILSSQGRPQFPNYKGYDADRILQFERKGNQLFARTSADGHVWNNMPGSPINVTSPTLGIGIYQTTYSPNASWAEFTDFVIYK